ncbi:MAG: hypothetical protein TR69_WS6001001290 [candidate division WS6 bacterium OLB20]|uniref:LamG-like jellyroll fold domain-containing protein n=1 Tax=candidate division WS6 bacterium OLB20 TaxID=1617426 RepID=A0A136LWH5_9BACT|nr:MAG: hypothetical protein TR69_WS6001001290 [candidate division WS6 bacterium OLB20]
MVNESVSTSGTGSLLEDTQFHDFEIGWRSGAIDFRIDNTSDGTLSTNVPNEPSYIRFDNNSTSVLFQVDWVAVANYHDDPPDSQVVGSEQRSDRPAVYYPLNRNQTNSQIADEYFNTRQHKLTLGSTNQSDSADPVWSDQCIKDSCLLFDGANDFAGPITDGQFASVSNTFSMSIWAHPTATRVTTAEANGNNFSAGHQHRQAIAASQGTLLYGSGRVSAGLSVGTNGVSVIEHGSSYFSTPLVHDMALSGWNHIVVVYENKQPRIYVNGYLVHTGITSDRTAIHPSNYLGDTQSNYGTFKGFLDEFRLYPRVLTETEIRQQYNEGSSVLGVSTGGSALSNGLVGWWKMDETAANQCSGGVNDSCDSSGSGNDMAWAGNTSASGGKYGNAMLFDGTDDYMRRTSPSNIPTGASPRTVSAWVHLNALGTKQAIFQYGPIGVTRNTLLLNISAANVPEFTSWADGATSSTALSTGVWYHLVGTYDGDLTMKIYINGELDTTHTLGGQLISTVDATGINMGAWQAGILDDLNGRLDDVRLYDRELSEVEVQELYGYRPEMLAHWKFDEKSGTTAYDSTINARNGTLTNMQSPGWINGRVGGALEFDGTNDFVSVGTQQAFAFPLSSSFSVSAWINPALDSSDDVIIGNAWDEAGWHMRVTSANRVRFIVLTNGSNNTYSDTAVLSAGWNHVTAIWNGSTVKTYLNGVESSSVVSNGTVSTITPANPLLIGNDIADQSHYFNGTIDDVRIWNYQLTDSEVYKVFQGDSQSSSQSGLYERTVTLSSATPLDNYQVRIALTGFDYNKVQANGEDIRFYAGGNQLDYWIETWNTSGTSVIWVEVPYAGTNALSMQYGDASAVAGSDGAATFIFFTDLSSDPGLTGTNSANGYANYDSANDDIVYYFRRDTSSLVNRYFDLGMTTDPTNIAIDFRWRRTSQQLNQFGDAFGFIGISKVTVPGTIMGYNYINDTDSAPNAFFRGAYNGIAGGSGISSNTTTYQVSSGIDGTDAEMTAWQNGSQVINSPRTITSDAGGYSRFNIYRQNYGNAQDFNNHVARIDDIRIRKFSASVEPLTTTVQAEGIALSSVNVTAEQTSSPSLMLNLDSKSGTTATDSGTLGTNGTLTNMDDSNWVRGRFGSAVNLNGTDEFISVANSTALNSTDFSVSAWIRTTSSGVSRVLTKEGNTNGQQRYSLGTNVSVAGRADVSFYGTSVNTAQSTSTVNDGEWHHILGTFSDTNNRLRIYVDGVLEATTTTTQTPVASSNPLEIGRFDSAAGQYFNGSVDQVRYWERELSPREAAIEFDGGKPVAWYKFDEIEGNTAYDHSGNQLHGTLSNMSPSTDWINGKINGALDFDGSNDGVDLPENSILNFGFNDEVTVSAWVKPTVLGDDYIFSQQRCNGGAIQLYITSLGAAIFRVQDTSSNQTFAISDNSLIQTGSWNHIVGTRDKETDSLRLYVNGNLVEDLVDNTLTTITNASTENWVGRRYPCALTDNINATIDEVKIWRYALIQEDVSREYTANGAALRIE